MIDSFEIVLIALAGVAFATLLLCALILQRAWPVVSGNLSPEPTRIQRMFATATVISALSFVPHFINTYLLPEPSMLLADLVNVWCVGLFSFIPLEALVLQQKSIRWYHLLVVLGPLVVDAIVGICWMESTLHMLLDASLFWYEIGLTVYSLVVLKRWDTRLLELYSDVVNKQTLWFRRLVCPMLVIPFLWLLMESFPNARWLMVVFYVIEIGVFLFFTSYALEQEEFVVDDEQLEGVEKSLLQVETPKWVSELVRLMEEEHIYRNDQLSRQNLAEKLNVNRTYLSTYIKTAYGLSFCDYVNRYRLKEARTLLEEGKMSVSEVAVFCGYRDHRAFYRVFRREYGIAPTQIAISTPAT